MGQRHQAFVIARVVAHGASKATYRCIAARHHQWCFGTLPLRATRRFLDLIKQENNARIIKKEIEALHGKYGRFNREPALPDVPCPYIALLLAMAWNIDIESPDGPYSSGSTIEGGILPASMGSGDGGK